MVRKINKRKTYESESVPEFIQSDFSYNPDYIHEPVGEKIILQGVSTNNLKGIDITLPKNQIITVTGVSGSGKSSFAFDTLYKEGQFRYIESLSSYLRQFFNLGAKPEIEYSSGLSPAVAIEQNKRVGNVRSSVGTLTEIDDYLRLLYAKIGDPYCYSCGEPIRAQSVEGIMDQIFGLYKDQKIYMLQEIGYYETLKEFQKFIKRNRTRMDRDEGYTRYLTLLEDDSVVEYFYLESPNIPEKFFPIKVYGIFDRITVADEHYDRMREDIVKLLNEGNKFGVYQSLEGGESIDSVSMKIGKDVYNSSSAITRYTDKIFCPHCNITYPEFTTQHFSPNRPEGACPTCHGIGETLDIDLQAVIDVSAPYMDAIIPWKDSALGQQILAKLASKYSINDKQRWSDLPEYFMQVVIQGDAEQLRISQGGKYVTITYRGLHDILTSQYNKGVLGVDFQSMFNLKPCESCHGDRLRPESLNVFLELPHQEHSYRYNLAQLQKLPIRDLVQFLDQYKHRSDKPIQLIDRILGPLLERSQTIGNLGLGYLNLARVMDTLSGGEIQRLRLAKQLGNKLTGIMYVLDEPTIGLDDAEIQRVIEAIRTLKDMGNTIVVVEHNEEFIQASDRVVEIGPGAGDFGGELVFSGPYDAFIKTDTLTAQYVTGRKQVSVKFEHIPTHYALSIKGAHEHNLKSVDTTINLGSFTIITGPSGAGKTTLMYHTLFKFLDERTKYIQGYIRLAMMQRGISWKDILTTSVIDKKEYAALEEQALVKFHEEIKVHEVSGYDTVSNVIYVDQSGIGKTPRSCPATFIGVFDNIRKMFAATQDAKLLGFTDSYFSFNSNKGACPECDGYGIKKVELQFLPDTYVPCTLCKGKRYKSEILTVRWHGKTISEILEMYVHEAYDFFSEIGFIADELHIMVDIGLGYIKLGQAAHTLSGGESQRLKLVKHLLKQYKGHSIYFLDEPTVGLHPEDIQKLLLVLKHFLDRGDTILMIEHDKSLLQFADNVIRLKDGAIVK